MPVSVAWSASRMSRTSSVADQRREALERAASVVGLRVEREAHAQPELGVVLEQRVGPGRVRDPAAFTVQGVVGRLAP